jgi:uncharacterized protein (TIGR02246 family)
MSNAPSTTTTPTTNGAPSAVIDAVTAVVAELQRTLHREDVDGFAALFHPDAVWVTAHGRRLIGRDEIAAFTATVLPGSTAISRSAYEVVHVAAIRPDVVAVGVRQWATTLDDDALDEPEGRPTYIMATDASGAWKLVAGQNTIVFGG